MSGAYQKNGYSIYRNCFTAAELDPVRKVLQKHHALWVQDNRNHYETRAVNSAYLTSQKYLDTKERQTLFNFISHQSILEALSEVIPDNPAFMGTQLFFNPANAEKRNYWHRDIQYNNLSVDQQKAALSGPNVLHVRVPLADEPGVELVPGTHSRWDTSQEYEVRLEENGRHSYDDLPDTQPIPMNAGDVLIFSANMIHRGLYGMDRFALDILFCDPDPDLVKYIQADCLPDESMLQNLDNKTVFSNTIQLKKTSGDTAKK